MKQHLISSLLAGALLLSLAACGGTVTPIPDDDTAKSPAVSAAPGAAAEPQAVTITPGTVLLDWEGLTVTARELAEDEIWGPELKVLVENNSQQNLGVGCDSLVVNGYMLPPLFSATVAAGKKSNESITLSDLEKAGITTIADLTLRLHVFDSDSYHTLYRAEDITLPTSASGTVTQPPLDQGRELLNQNGIRVVARGVENGGILGSAIQLFLENQSGQDVIVSCDDLSVNGFMVSSLLSCDVNDGCMALDEIDLMNTDLEENGIENIETVELTFRILDPSSFHTIAELGPVSLTLD